jgi:hypothetical protein
MHAPDYGSFHVDYTGEEDTKLNMPEDFDRRYSDYYQNRKFNKVKFSDKENSLVSFFLQLTRYLQQAIGTIPAIDLNAYSKAIGFEIDEEIWDLYPLLHFNLLWLQLTSPSGSGILSSIILEELILSMVKTASFQSPKLSLRSAGIIT